MNDSGTHYPSTIAKQLVTLTGWTEKWRAPYSGGDGQIRRFPYGRSRYRIPAKSNRSKHCNYHFSHEVKPSEGPVAARTRLPRLH